MRLPFRLAVVLVLSGAGVVPAAASAAITVSVAGGTFAIAGDKAANSATVTRTGDTFVVTAPPATPPTAVAACMGTAAAVTCPAMGVTAAVLTGGLGDDDLTVMSDLQVATTLLDGGAGVDVLRGGPGAETLDGGLGDDELDGGGGVDAVRFRRAPGSFVDAELPDLGARGFASAFSPDSDQEESDTLAAVEDFDGGDEDDFVTGNAQANMLRGGAGDDVFTPGGGDDRVFGDAGADAMSADFDTVTDGNDSFDGGPDAGQRGDAIRYDGRARAVDVVLPPAGASTADNGSGNESDTLANVEEAAGGDVDDVLKGSDAVNVLEGGLGADQLAGGAGADVLVGGDGADALAGGTGDDLLLARDGPEDRDGALSCGEGADQLVADNAIDARPADCERLAPQFIQTPALSGPPTAQTALTVTGTATSGDPAPLSYEWFVCSSADVEDPCQSVSREASYTPKVSEVGFDLFVDITAGEAQSPFADFAFVEGGKVGPAAAVTAPVLPSQPPPGPPTRPVAGPTAGGPPAVLRKDPLVAARKLLGAGARLSTPSFAPLAFTYASADARGRRLKLGKRAPRVLAFVCALPACRVRATGTLSTTPRGKGKKVRTTRLEAQRLALVGDHVGALHVRLSASRRADVRRARKASVRLRITVTASDGRTLTRTVRYAVRIAGS